ncbi:DUF397 domain-containing protein [Streptomyces incanus]|uniref:DUF397 domain-containing protein n=1 Tax=Streptomyces incanus TaxID=887453 RepID=A0ABW0XUW3_9ACTN
MTEPLRWRKSSFSGGGDGNTCVETATPPTRIAVRDSKRPSHEPFSVPASAFAHFIASLKSGIDAPVNL